MIQAPRRFTQKISPRESPRIPGNFPTVLAQKIAVARPGSPGLDHTGLGQHPAIQKHPP
jgi:hypothetical protein